MTKTNAKFNPKVAAKQYKEILSIDSKILELGDENAKQIRRDLARTYPSSELFKSDIGQNKMLNVLQAFSNYDREISKFIQPLEYVQGMNFIVGFFLYHAEEYAAFWLFVTLIEEYEMRMVYEAGIFQMI